MKAIKTIIKIRKCGECPHHRITFIYLPDQNEKGNTAVGFVCTHHLIKQRIISSLEIIETWCQLEDFEEPRMVAK